MIEPKIVGIIPGRMASTRFPNKMLYPIFNYPMIEHVRRRAMLSELVDEIYVATCDDLIADTVKNAGGNVIMTSDQHLNATSRIAEAVKNIDCSHVILLLGDEPLILPDHVDSMAKSIIKKPKVNAWKAVGPLDSVDSISDSSVVKCVLGLEEQILYCFRKSPSIAPPKQQITFIKKLLGVSAFRKEFLLKLGSFPIGFGEKYDSIEELRVLENGFKLNSIVFRESLPSVNEVKDLDKMYEYVEEYQIQKTILKQIFDCNF